MEPVLPEVSDPQMLVPLFLCWALMFGLCPHAFCRTTQGLLIYVWSPRCSLRSAVLQFAGKCTTMKSMKAMNPMKAVKAMPTSTGDADCGSGGAKYEAPAWAVAPFYEGGTFANCAQLEGRCWVMSEAIPLSITVGELLETMTSPGCGKGFWYEPIGLAMAVRAHRSQGDDKGSDDDKKKDDDSPKDDGKKKDDDPEESEPEESSTHSMTPGPYRLVCPDDGTYDAMDDDSPKDDDEKKDDHDRKKDDDSQHDDFSPPHTPPFHIPGHLYNSSTRSFEPLR